MKELTYNTEDPIAALATGWEESAIAVIRTSGSDAIGLASNIFSNKGGLQKAEGGTIVYGYVVDPETGERVDEVLAAVFRAPKSYTGEDSVEFYCHGGIPAVSVVLSALKKGGFRDAAPGEFTMRAFINGKLDLTRAEAVHEIVTARTARAHSLALNRLSGGLEKRIDGLKKRLLDMLSSVELLLDYPEDELDGQAGEYPLDAKAVSELCADIGRLAESFKAGKVFRDGVPVALAGRTNAGKSSLFNLLLREDRAIVSEVHGTTRDYIESWITVKGIPLRLFDTAGLRASDNPVEAEGIKRSGEVIAEAGIVLYLVDSTEGLNEEDEAFISGFEDAERLIKLWSKIDTVPAAGEENDADIPEGFIPVSSVSGKGLNDLEDALSEAALGRKGLEDDVVIDSMRQRDLLSRAKEALVNTAAAAAEEAPLDAAAMELRDALDALGEITGEVSSADILNNIFSNFCVGK
ncbi:MAG: tRNA uridine-5-carboxymethylaminomethyl(34) synthesis GTPase MnmE [Spirochaetales bacterium]|uniref:tRNA modification GTPase MnmE n=1 Tax=Candidatus Thalassospirochaeta sargassi TaxID=3119039 RepID=A0AAJ1IFH0_9SPIO|nr:tRNA uridine-5-carboxymethylaminomethyl(34) synthesis GTPase MnmE [Spirochaetales bacterium]